MGFNNIRLLISYYPSNFVMDGSILCMAMYEYNRSLDDSVLSWACNINATCC